MPRPGPGFASSRNSTDLPVVLAISIPSGVNTPWLIALFRKNTFAGSIRIDANGNRPALIRNATPAPRAPMIASITGDNRYNDAIAMIEARMPAEKLSTSISNPGAIFPAQIASIFFISHAVNGPMIIAPRNIVDP